MDNLKISKVETVKTYRVEHLPELDVVLNLDYIEFQDCDEIMEILKNNPLGKNLDIDGLILKVSSIEDEKGKKFFVKEKEKLPIDFIKNPQPDELSLFSEDFHNKKARYAFIGILNEIILAKKIKKIVYSSEVQELVKKYNFAGIEFAEPISALVYKDGRRKYLIYKNLVHKGKPSHYYNNADTDSLANDLRKIFLENGIYPGDLKYSQFMTIERDSKSYIVLIDVEAYTEINKPIVTQR